MKKEIKRKCACGCGGITNSGRRYVHGHNRRDKKLSIETKEKMSLAKQNISDATKEKMSKAQQDKKRSAETKLKMSEAKQNMSNETKIKISETLQGRRLSAETKLKMSLAQMKDDPNYPYCDVWKDKEYRNDLKKDYCENADCKKTSKRLHNHHIYLDKKKCKPNDIMTICSSCHSILHRKLERGTRISADPEDFIIINRPDHVSYIHKESRTIIIRIEKRKLKK